MTERADAFALRKIISFPGITGIWLKIPSIL